MSQPEVKKRNARAAGTSTTMEPPSSTSTAKQRRTLMWNEAAEWQRDSKYILSGYRREKPDYLELLTSLTFLHNETCNVYTHLIGAMLLPLIATTIMRGLSQSQFSIVSGTDYIMFAIFFWSAECCLLFSTAFHLFGAHSRPVEQFCHRMDLLGIVIVTMGTFIPGIYYIYFCQLSLQKFHWFIVRQPQRLLVALALKPSAPPHTDIILTQVIISGSSTSALICVPVFSTLRWRKVKIGACLMLGGSALIPLLHGSQLYSLEYMTQYSGMNWYLLELAIYASGTVLYALRIPEHFAPGFYGVSYIGHLQYPECA